MIDEAQQDQAALHALGLLAGDDMKALAGAPEVLAFADELATAAAALVHALPATNAPAAILPRVLARIHAERAPAPRVYATVPHTNWQPLALAASIAIAATAGFFTGMKIASARSERQIASLSTEVAEKESEREKAATLALALKDERAALEKRIYDLRQRDALSQLRIATMKSQLRAYAKVVAVAVWDGSAQQGLVRFDNLPPAASGKDYQMWVIDPRNPKPVSAGVFSAGGGAALDVKFKPEQPIALADKFAVSLEQKGGTSGLPTTVVLMSN